MVEHVIKFLSIRVNVVSSRRFSFADYIIINGAFFLCHVMLFWLFLERHPFIYIRRRDFFFAIKYSK